MPLLGEGRNLMMDALVKGTSPTIHIVAAGLLTAEGEVETIKSTSSTVLEKASHGLTTGTLVQIVSCVGGEGLITKADHCFWVKELTSSTFSLYHISALTGSAVEWGAVAITALKLRKLKEHAATSPYARQGITFSSATANGTNSATLGSPLEIPAKNGVFVDAVGLYSATSTGTLLNCEKVAHEAIGGTEKYVISEIKLDDNVE